ncbi:gliding motility-associated C-terminal domain-containing protein, partial [Tenacibaculum sp. FZY0031]|uniref:gliding motility-associated C-terminal domain-containing protein n=1 Tax=Tenacibaculum sp. FZY0031 TaxID=3116648 RepID=UPI002ECB70D5|nr:gliding motility-associated C-terminal domain-containing protein [Tenacibaculum sp. FZY0031]
SVSNQATVTGTSISGNDVSDASDDNSILENDPTQTNLCQSDGIALIKTALFNDENSDGCSNVGETITYSFTLTNTGNTTITNVVLTDPMLGGTIALASGDTDNDNLLDVGETWTYSANYTITQTNIDTGSVSNQATVTGTSISGNDVSDASDDNSILENDPTQTNLCQPNNIYLEKISHFNDANGDGYANIGEIITYNFIIHNTGASTLYNITLQDNLPGITINGSSIAQLLSGEVNSTTFTATYSITQQDLTNGTVTNQALATAEDSSGNSITDISDDPNNLDNIDIDNDGDPDDPTITTLLIEEIAFEIFNAVSPDGDGSNDFFRINGIENYPNNNLKVFNRWGVLVYQTDAYGANGNLFRGISEGRATVSKDQKLPTGTYFYILTRWDTDQQAMTNKGYLYLKRN